MTPHKTTCLVLVMFSILCALPAAGVVLVPSAIGQEEDNDDEDASLIEDDENLASGIVSNVLDDDSGDDDQEENTDDDTVIFGDDSGTQRVIPIIDEDQRAADLALNEGVDVDVVQKVTRTTTPPSTPPGDEDAFFCLEDIDFGVLCFSTPEDCEFVEALFVGFIVSECEEFETPPSDAQICTVVEDPLDISCDPV
jgi:hypothetical protein